MKSSAMTRVTDSQINTEGRSNSKSKVIESGSRFMALNEEVNNTEAADMQKEESEKSNTMQNGPHVAQNQGRPSSSNSIQHRFQKKGAGKNPQTPKKPNTIKIGSAKQIFKAKNKGVWRNLTQPPLPLLSKNSRSNRVPSQKRS
ncbi:hypothetical protein PIB30_057574 [Stylosanthes scabra]|uniref:Uncharacterized protein n=1 Tax=Stylosanthes scabra TaxID=79078 RepID=A0ABU6QKD2_9FABA|nr:hypothetical protein [Stylosanthes scabra]